METKTCRDCQIEKALTDFRLHSKNSPYRRSYCKACHNSRTEATRSRKTDTNPAKKQRVYARVSEERKSPEHRAKYLVYDCRQSDRKKGRECDLTVEAVKTLIEQPCHYCTDTTLLRTLDRVDNGKGHTLDNVLPSCIRCNMIRGSIPFPAWEAMVPGIRDAVEQGLFGDWTGSIHK